MTMKGYSHSSKLQHYRNVTIRLFSVISKTLVGQGSYPSAEKQSVYSAATADCANIYIYIYTHIYTHTHIYIYTHTYIYIYIYTHTYIYMCVCVCVYECVCIYKYMYNSFSLKKCLRIGHVCFFPANFLGIYIYIYIYKSLKTYRMQLVYIYIYIYIYIRGAYDKFSDFFRMGTFIDSTHMNLESTSK